MQSESIYPRGARWRGYVLAIGWVGAALLLRFLLNPVLGQQGPYLILTLSIVLAALYGGFGPAMLATGLGTFIGTYLFIGSRPGWESVFETPNIARTVLFLLIGLSISVIGGRLRASKQELSEAVRGLRSSNRAKDHVLATVAHEMRSPLSALTSANQVLARSTQDPARIVWASDLIGRQLSQLSRMSDDLMDMSKVLHGNIHVKMDPVDLRDVVTAAVEQCGPLIADKRHHLTTGQPSEPAMVRGDANRLVQVFANLLTNAAKYTEPGGQITLRLAPVGREWHFSVADNGQGLNPEALDEIFEPFVQAPDALDNPNGGLGLGLAIVKRIIQLHGGRVSASSPGPGGGSRFEVALAQAA